jgi:type IV secretion system protein VirD4
LSRVSFYTRPYDRLEPYDGKLSRTVLRGGAGSNASLLPDIRSEKDILKLVNTIIANTKGDGEKSGEDFWIKAERLLYCALIGYIWYEAPEEEQNFSTLLEFINASEAREDDETFKNAVDELFEELEQKKPEHFAVRQYKKYKLAAGKTAKSILISCGGKSFSAFEKTFYK